VQRLLRAPGEREARWVHLLCGEPVVRSASAQPAAAAAPDTLAALEARVAALEDQLRRLLSAAE